MRRRKIKLFKKNTMKFKLFIVFFLIIINVLVIYNFYIKMISQKVILLTQEKTDKIMYQFFTDLVTDDLINYKTTNDLLEMNMNDKEEIVSVEYNLEKTYNLLTKTSKIIKESLNNFENGKINVKNYDKYLKSNKNGLILNVPFFIGSKNVFLNNIGPMIPVVINFNGALLTNIKTKVSSYGFNNALLEIYITVEIDKLIITPVVKDSEKFYYDILIGALVVHGSVPKFYGSEFETNSNILDIPLS